jgi:hypothetical protein
MIASRPHAGHPWIHANDSRETRIPAWRALEVGDRIVIGGLLGIVRALEPVLGELELRLVVQLWREGVDS